MKYRSIDYALLRCRLAIGLTVLAIVSSNSHGQDAKQTSQTKAGRDQLLQRIKASDFSGVVRKTEPLTPEQERAGFVLPPGFEIQLVAAEPDIVKPLNMAFDARGRLWVTSSKEYPFAAPKGRKPQDTIKILEDTNNDGRADKITTFADGLNIPMGLYPYKDGVICFSIPNVWFLRDTDGDDKADKREKLFGPMGFEKDTHGMCNAFTRGLDGWLYSCHGFNNLTTVSGRDGHQITMTSGNTFRMQLNGQRVEHYTRGLVNPFGMTFDSNGDLFVADCHTKPISLLLHGGYYDSFGAPHDGLGYVPNVMDHLHGSTAIGGIAQYNATNFPAAYRGHTFGGNVMTSRINRNSLHYTGSSIRAHEEPDFLLSQDPWFRPADLQVGPDGALYVTDFYNRIIGHYEIDLDHPGRDRLRGRIWRIIYTGDASETSGDHGDVSPHRSTNLAALKVEELVKHLASQNLTVRNLATDRLVDHFGKPAVNPTREFMVESHSPMARAHGLWVLLRLQSLSPADLQQALNDASDVVRIHAFRVLKALGDRAQVNQPRVPNRLDSSSDWLLQGFKDRSALVRRAAVMAAAAYPAQQLIEPLIALSAATPEGDVHLRHAIQMTLRDHLQNTDWFRDLDKSLAKKHMEMLATICLSLKSPEAGDFLAGYIDQLDSTEQNDRLTEYMQFAARYVSVATVDVLVSTSRKRFADNSKLQLELLKSVREGIEKRGNELPQSVRAWALELATTLIGSAKKRGPSPLSWTASPHPNAGSGKSPWVISTKRKSADGMLETPLYSSFPRGEKLTGVFRSSPFKLNKTFSFYLAGHDGNPSNDVQQKNYVRLKDSTTLAILREWQPPRNDTAQKFEWNSGESAGRSVSVELVDGDSGSGYAWLAAGRFSEVRLNPSQVVEQRREGAQLAGAFKLVELRNRLATMLLVPTIDDESATQVAIALTQMDTTSDSRLATLALVPGIAGVTRSLKHAALHALVGRNLRVTPDLLRHSMQAATKVEQLRMAEQLATDSVGAELLVKLVESGRAAARLLLRPSVSDRLTKSASQTLQKKIKRLSAGLPSEDERLGELIADRKTDYLSSIGSVDRGAALFKKSCLNCHQVKGVGKQVGPNLDGIGSRGLDRLVEDILAPNRNVDVAFRSSTIVTTQGKVYSGLLKKTDGATLLLIDSKGQEISLPKASIDEQTASKLSPMPANLSETLTKEQFRDLMAYVLSLRK